MNVKEELFKLQDKDYKEFQSKLIPNINCESIIGVRTPDLKELAKRMYKDNNYSSFLEELPHTYYEENQLHGFILGMVKDYDECIGLVNKFLPYIDNWSTCDQTVPKSFIKNKDLLINEIKKWIKSEKTYTIRFGVGMLMRAYLDEDFKEEYLDMVSKIRSNEYYVNMMIAWYFATALTKQYDSAIKYIENNRLDTWVHNKTIQKAVESYRISKEEKNYLKSLKINR